MLFDRTIILIFFMYFILFGLMKITDDDLYNGTLLIANAILAIVLLIRLRKHY